MSASIHRYSCEQLGICQQRQPSCRAECASHATPNEAADVPPVSAQGCINACGILLTVLAMLTAFALGTTAGSALLHSFDSEIRQAVLWAWEQLVRLYWASVHISG
jgi:hypothetical protein